MTSTVVAPQAPIAVLPGLRSSASLVRAPGPATAVVS
ncbi:hypothetical protein SAMN05216207_1008155 [Pseudonocardia ammonioxydans]|uniref:Uncharacterized protein n=1 Tax=Pseudonocardia ammonioxydans TaxID=260086 RepID=A0A1I4WK68_PSUAM|nr:hypothetical protein SAMN05216207_1008155 [Pseudonocardia ammonioxydans]